MPREKLTEEERRERMLESKRKYNRKYYEQNREAVIKAISINQQIRQLTDEEFRNRKRERKKQLYNMKKYGTTNEEEIKKIKDEQIKQIREEKLKILLKK